MKGVGGTRDLKSLNEERQATLLSSLFWSCVQPKASNGLWHLALLQTWVCVCMCVLVRRQHYFSLPGVSVRTIFLSYISAFIRISSPERHAYLLSAYLVSLGSGKHICVWWGLSGRQKEAASCVRLRCWGQGRSLRVFGLGLQLACADWAGAWRENPAEETNKQVAASKGLTSLVLVITLTLTFKTRTCWSNELNAEIC